MLLKCNESFKSRKEISKMLGGDIQKGITKSNKYDVILMFTNEDELYSDYFYPKGTYDYCMYTGIGRNGHQDNLENNMYNLNMSVLTHKESNKHLLVFEKRKDFYYFVGEYQLIETHQNVQPDAKCKLRRVFVFHLKKISDIFEFST